MRSAHPTTCASTCASIAASWFRGSWLATYFEIQNATNRENRSVQQWNTKTRAVEWREQVALLPLVEVNWKF